VLIWLFIGLWMAAILFTSSVAAPPETGASILGILKAKGGHVFVYATLGWALRYALTSPRGGLGFGRVVALIGTLATAIVFAIIDETRQSFVYGRTALPTDVLLDSVAAVAGAVLQQRSARWLTAGPSTSGGPDAASDDHADSVRVLGAAEDQRRELREEHLAVAADGRQEGHHDPQVGRGERMEQR